MSAIKTILIKEIKMSEPLLAEEKNDMMIVLNKVPEAADLY